MENDYTIRDKDSKLVLAEHDVIVEICKHEKSPEAYIELFLEQIEEVGVHYMVTRDGNVYAMPKPCLMATPGEYYDNWKDAENAWVDKQFELGNHAFSAAMDLKKLQGTYQDWQKKNENFRIVSKGK